jgi:hypothetical protein
MQTLPFDAFISYATEDEELATDIAKGLKNRGFSVWFAPLNLKVGDRLLDSINAGLSLSRTGLLLLSPAYLRKKWTGYELDVLHRQHIEDSKRLLPIWHGVSKENLDAWNRGLSAIIALKTDGERRTLLEKLAAALSDNAPLRGVAPSWESPFWRFLQGRGELNSNHVDGATLNIYEAIEFPDKWFPIYFDGKNYSREELIFNVAQILAHHSYPEWLRHDTERLSKLKSICVEYGYNPDIMG